MGDSLDAELRKEEQKLLSDLEIQRILASFQLDYYSVMGIQPGMTKQDISKLYRKKSLLIHPDKSENKRAVDAFDALKKASNALNDDESREKLDKVWADARNELIAEKGWNLADQRLDKDSFLGEWKARVKEILVESEVLKKVAMKREQHEQAKKRKLDDEVSAEVKRQREKDKDWEDKRGQRVSSWRKFKKKRKNTRDKVLI